MGTVKRRYTSGAIRKQGLLNFTSNEKPLTVGAVSAQCKDKFKLPVLRLFVPESGGGEVELKASESLGDWVAAVIVEKDENARPEREGAAFERSVFRGGPLAPTGAA